MTGYKVAFLLFGLAVASALPQPQINWPDRPSWWPENRPWPPQKPESIGWPDRPSWWPEQLPWPFLSTTTDAVKNAPSWWPDSIPWPPQHPEWIPWPPQHPEWIPWPPTHPEWIPWPPQFPDDAPSWWPDVLPWPPTEHPEWIPWPPALPEQWPEQPSWWPDSLPWPPALPDQWPDQPSWWPENLPWPPTEHPEWIPWPPTHPEGIPWPPALPEQWPDQPSWWPDSLPWPPTEHPEWIPWPPSHPEWIPWPPTIPDIDIPYIPSRDNQFHLFTRNNPQVSQPLVLGNSNLLSGSNFVASRKTIVLVHDLNGSATTLSNAVLVPALLASEDVNIIIVDWSRGADSGPALSTFYSVLSGNFVSRFLDWLARSSNADLGNFHLVGVGLGALNVGFIGRRLDSRVGQVTALDPSRGPSVTTYLPPLNVNVARYAEVIHTDAGNTGYSPPLGDVDFYVNGGSYQPGCGGDSTCNRLRAVYFFAESVQTGGFTGVECASHREALASSCSGAGRLNMGGLASKAGESGVYFVGTNAAPPFSQG